MLHRIREWLTLWYVLFILLVTGGAVTAIGIGAYEFIAATESSVFCGEICHTPIKFTGFLVRTSAAYGTDEVNTRRTSTIVLKVGGGVSGVASGIHWHTAAEVW